jgi:SAM-dependent methyltransferase
VLDVSDYVDYEAFDEDPGRDKIEFGAGVPIGRSAAIVEHLSSLGLLTDETRVLDYGCNRGAFLALLPPGAHAGLDVSEHHRATIERLGCTYHTPDAPPPEDAFDLLTLVHVFEHLVDPGADLAAGLRALRPGGHVVIQVPDADTQPTDLYIADHRSHFRPETLDLAMANIGLAPVRPVTRMLGGELTGIYRVGEAPQPPAPRAAQPIVDVLARGEAVLQSLVAAGNPIRVYGAGLLGGLVISTLGPLVVGAIDDDPAVQRAPFRGCDVVASDAVPRGTEVVVAVPPSAASRVEARCHALGLRPHTPYTLDAG